MNSTGLTIKVDFIEREDRTSYADLLDNRVSFHNHSLDRDVE